ncbi:MAG TPA: site-2 protease family protein [Candidatus Thalassarchaeaceae archaeon]|nr:site-2 protease family protein [Candidatus Thalassarchaeaceae archaeon]
MRAACTDVSVEPVVRRSFLLPIVTLYLLYVLGMPTLVVLFLAAWYAALIYSEDMGYLDRLNATRVLGIILMLRTNRGKRALNFISKRRGFWRKFGEFSIWLCFIVMLLVVLLLFASAIQTAISPSDDYIPARDLVFIPGVTSFIPFWWPALALIVTLVIHEYSHGIQARAHGMNLRSFGLLMVGPIPIGAFAEPEEEEMSRAPRRERMRLFAAGPSINILATYLVLILLSSVSSGLVAQNEGIHARAIIEGSAAEEYGLMPYETITHINGMPTGEYSQFSDVMDTLSSGEVAVFTVLSSPSPDIPERAQRDIDITLDDRYEYLYELCEGDLGCIENSGGAEQGEAFLGVYGAVSATAAADGYSYIVDGEYPIGLTSVLAVFQPLVMLQTPISLDGQTMILEEREMLEAGTGLVGSVLGTDGMLMLFDFLFWLVWVNFLLGFANLIPMVPFDGGHMVRDAVHSTLKFIQRGAHPLKIESLANRISSISSFFILFILAIPVIIPRLL